MSKCDHAGLRNPRIHLVLQAPSLRSGAARFTLIIPKELVSIPSAKLWLRSPAHRDRRHCCKGGGHAPDIIVVCELDNVLPSSTNPTRPYAMNTLDEHLDVSPRVKEHLTAASKHPFWFQMLMVCHHLDASLPEDVAFAESRIRAETVAAEDVLHDIGAISMISSDSQAMGRVGEVVSRTWRTASKMRTVRGPLEGDEPGRDNNRVKRYVAKYTVNP